MIKYCFFPYISAPCLKSCKEALWKPKFYLGIYLQAFLERLPDLQNPHSLFYTI